MARHPRLDCAPGTAIWTPESFHTSLFELGKKVVGLKREEKDQRCFAKEVRTETHSSLLLDLIFLQVILTLQESVLNL